MTPLALRAGFRAMSKSQGARGPVPVGFTIWPGALSDLNMQEKIVQTVETPPNHGVLQWLGPKLHVHFMHLARFDSAHQSANRYCAISLNCFSMRFS
jgi:hypothetical protein